MDQLEKLNSRLTPNGVVFVIPEYKCRKCGATFKLDPIIYPIHPGNYTRFHSECSDNYVGIADLQGFTEVK